MNDRAFRGIWIPAEVWLSKELSLIEKVLFVEIDSLDNEDGCYATNKYFMDFFDASESTITRSIANLKRLGYIESEMTGGRTRILRVVKMTTQSSQIDDAGSSKNSVSSIKEKNKNNNIKDKAPVPGALAKHPRNFTKQTLTDDLQSGKDIDEQKKEKKKVSEYDKCYKEIDDRYTDKNINSLLHQHLDWSYHSKDPQRLRNLKVFKKRLDELDKLDNKEEVIKQSLQKHWHCFYELQIIVKTNKGHETLSDKLVMTDVESARKRLQEAIENGEEFY